MMSPGVDVFDALLDGVGVAVNAVVGLYGAGRYVSVALQVLRQRERLGQQVDDLFDAFHGFGVSLVYVTVQPGMGDYLDVVAQVVEDEDGVAEHEHRLGHALGVNRGGLHPRLEVADGVVGDVAHRAAVEAGEAVHRVRAGAWTSPLPPGMRGSISPAGSLGPEVMTLYGFVPMKL